MSLAGLRSARIGHGSRVVLNDVDLDLAENESVGVFGPNGGGKSTLLRTLIGVQRPLGGQVRILEGVAYVPQSSDVDPLLPITLEEWIQLGTRGKADVVNAAKQVGLEHALKQRLADLSGGERRRAFLAHALTRTRQRLALDEPTSGVDADEVERLVALLGALRADGTTLFFVSHSPELLPLADRHLWVSGGRVESVDAARIEGHLRR